jgi:hypothetical protein
VKRPGREGEHWPLYIAEVVKNLWKCTSTPPYAFLASTGTSFHVNDIYKQLTSAFCVDSVHVTTLRYWQCACYNITLLTVCMLQHYATDRAHVTTLRYWQCACYNITLLTVWMLHYATDSVHVTTLRYWKCACYKITLLKLCMLQCYATDSVMLQHYATDSVQFTTLRYWLRVTTLRYWQCACYNITLLTMCMLHYATDSVHVTTLSYWQCACYNITLLTMCMLHYATDSVRVTTLSYWQCACYITLLEVCMLHYATDSVRVTTLSYWQCACYNITLLTSCWGKNGSRWNLANLTVPSKGRNLVPLTTYCSLCTAKRPTSPCAVSIGARPNSMGISTKVSMLSWYVLSQYVL